MERFRDSIAYNHDFITGERIEVVKRKPLIVPARGIATVELFDAITGKKTYEAKSMDEVFLKLARKAVRGE